MVYLWNPSIQRFLKLPSIRKSLKLPPSEAQFYTKDYLEIGLGYDSSINDYKVVAIGLASYMPSLMVYSLSNGSWRTISDATPNLCFHGPQAFSNGAIHWIRYHSRRFLPMRKDCQLILFSVHTRFSVT
ncbi:hypothetical protein Ancab_034016 [Ancistrocladus abbreviatus]